jgi:DNA polymerase-1
VDEAFAMKRWLSEDRGRKVLGLDTETSSLNPFAAGAELRTVQIGDERAGWTVPFHMWGGAVMECLNDWPGTIALHNANFDAKWLSIHAGWKVPWERIHDTLVMARIMYPGQPAGLKPLSDRLVDRRASAGQKLLDEAMKKEGWGWDTIPVDFGPYWQYAALDPIITAHLWKTLRADIHYPKVFDLEMGALRVCATMEQNGARVDVDYCERKSRELEEFVERTKKWGRDELGISIGSNQALARYFTDNLGAEITEVTKSGAPSVNEEQLQKFIASDDPRVQLVAQSVLNARKADKLRSAYFSNLINGQIDELVHCNINTMGAITGRMSIQNPALQTLPKRDKTVRHAFIPREGNRLVTSDLDQVEFRLFSSMSQDEGLQESFRRADATGGDAFTEIAREIYREPSLSKDDPRRAVTKTFIYSRLFGAGLEKQALSARVTVNEMREFSNTMAKRYPQMAKFQQDVQDVVGQREHGEGEGYVVTPLTGRRLPIDKGKNYKGVNYLIQSTAADVFKRNLLKMDQAGLTDLLVVPVHDEIVLDVPLADVDEVKATVLECMTTRDLFAVDLTSGIDGPYTSWGGRTD